MGEALKKTLQTTHVNSGESLDDLSRQSPLLIVFLRHSGCPFCREALARLKAEREQIESHNTRIVLVHMMDDPKAAKFFAKYNLDDVPRVSDSEQTLYQAFELKRGGITQVMGPGIWWKGFKTTILRGHLPGIPRGDVFQLAGTFLVADGEIVRAFRPANSADHPDYAELAACDLPGSSPAE